MGWLDGQDDGEDGMDRWMLQILGVQQDVPLKQSPSKARTNTNVKYEIHVCD